MKAESVFDEVKKNNALISENNEIIQRNNKIISDNLKLIGTLMTKTFIESLENIKVGFDKAGFELLCISPKGATVKFPDGNIQTVYFD